LAAGVRKHASPEEVENNCTAAISSTAPNCWDLSRQIIGAVVFQARCARHTTGAIWWRTVAIIFDLASNWNYINFITVNHFMDSPYI
jgi:hypothetical protein